MLRAIIRKTENGGWTDAHAESFYTVDFNAPELEASLKSGGYGPSAYEFHRLVGVEVLPAVGMKEADCG